jgi:hypothetical protein
MEKEIVICAAVQCTDGTIIRGHRHADAIRTARIMGKKPCTHPCDQGFITSRNHFVGRREGLTLQQRAGIASVARGGYRGDQLFSEDLY